MADRTYYRHNQLISPETKFIRLVEVIREAELRFLTCKFER